MKRKSAFMMVSANIAAVVLLFLLVEGIASLAMVAQEFKNARPVAERTHTRHDGDLGWVNIPGVSIKDMYGPGKYLKTNSQGFRNNEEFAAEVPAGKIRIVCSGDSFTLGYGVGNDNTWCSRLGLVDGRIEAVNMGQGGYGADQAFLWYKRDGTKIRHDVHLFAFITSDFIRMSSNSFLGYGKPVLAVENGVLVTKGVPVAKRSDVMVWLKGNLWRLNRLNSVRLAGVLLGKGGGKAEAIPPPARRKTREVVSEMMDELRRLNEKSGSVLALVFLPTKSSDDEATRTWREYLREETKRKGIVYFDLHEEFLKMPYSTADTLFIKERDAKFSYAAGHYTEEGNARVAEILYTRLLGVPDVAKKLRHTVSGR
ncbi:MAG: hypothetical protein HY896_05430 [Deltaproteobacteria bacterium]|nr:hypothetical protein [Deltaproteobacteria bacterium]